MRLMLLVLLRWGVDHAVAGFLEAADDHGPHHGSILRRVPRARQRNLPALLQPASTVSRNLKAGLVLVADLGHAHEAGIAPWAPL